MRKPVVIENPILNSPFEEPKRHFRFDDEGITEEVFEDRRISSYFVPIAKPKKKGKQEFLPGTEWTQDRIEEKPAAFRCEQDEDSRAGPRSGGLKRQ